MDAAIKEQWIKDLRSGDFKQGVGRLETLSSGEFCCLGVLCFRAAEAGVIDRTVHEEYGQVFYQGETAYLPDEVVEWSGIGTRPGAYRRGSDQFYGDLAQDNDCGAPFEEIAAIIDREF